MVAADYVAFVRGLQGLGIAFQREVTDAMQAVYWGVIRDEMSIEAFRRCCLAAAKELKFFPSPADLLTRRPSAAPEEPAWLEEPRPVWTLEQKAEARELRRKAEEEAGRARLPRDGGTIERPGWGCDEFEP
jgi:hypothetical protein